MSLRKLILLVIFFWGSADSKQPGGFKIQMKDGNFFINDGSGEGGVDLDNGPDISSLQDSSIKSNPSSPSLTNTLNLLDKTISDLGNDFDNKTPFSELDISNQREKISELRRFLGESNLVETLHGDETDLKSGPIDTRDFDFNKGTTKEKQKSKISDVDLQKIREVLDREYGKSILLVPKHDLESFINFVRINSGNDLIKSSDNAEFKDGDNRIRLRNPTNATNFQMNLNRLLSAAQPQANSAKQETPEESRQRIMQLVTRFLDEIYPLKESAQGPLKKNVINTFRDSNDQMIISSSKDQNTIKNEPRQEPVLKNFLENLSQDKTQLKQSLLSWFEKNSESDTSRQGHLDVRRSLKKSSTTSSPSKKDKKKRKNKPQKEEIIYQRISKGHFPSYRNQRHMPSNQQLNDYSSEDVVQLRDKRDFKPNHEQISNQRNFNQETEKEPVVLGERRTRADFIR